jgi:chemotaxis protein CheY-P-specific phosphatase CheC
MLKTIIEASENFCIHQIAEPHEINDVISKKRTLIAYIDIETVKDTKYRVYLGSETSFVQRVSKLFLEEDESDEETLIDMLLETVNLIVGSAKVIAEETNNNPFNISTPKFLKASTFDLEYDEIKTIKIKNDEMIIAIKELNVSEE